jgi:hypothetical protein
MKKLLIIPLLLISTFAFGQIDLFDNYTNKNRYVPGSPVSGYQLTWTDSRIMGQWADSTAMSNAYTAAVAGVGAFGRTYVDVAIWISDGTDWIRIAGTGGGGLANVVEDVTPQLGGDLDGQFTFGIDDILDLSALNDIVTSTGDLISTAGDVTASAGTITGAAGDFGSIEIGLSGMSFGVADVNGLGELRYSTGFLRMFQNHTANSTSGFLEINAPSGRVLMQSDDDGGVNFQSLFLVDAENLKTRMLVNDGTTSKIVELLHASALDYNADYSADYTDRSLVDKAWVLANGGGFDFDVTSVAVAITTTIDDSDYDAGTSILHIRTTQGSGITLDFNVIPTAVIGSQIQIRNNGTGDVTLAAGTASILGDTAPIIPGEFRTGVYTHTNLVWFDAGGTSGGASNLNDLGDWNIPTPTDLGFARFNSASGDYEEIILIPNANIAPSAIGGTEIIDNTVTNVDAAKMPQYTIKMNPDAGTNDAQDAAAGDVTLDTNPGTGDAVVIYKNTGEIIRSPIQDLPMDIGFTNLVGAAENIDNTLVNDQFGWGIVLLTPTSAQTLTVEGGTANTYIDVVLTTNQAITFTQGGGISVTGTSTVMLQWDWVRIRWNSTSQVDISLFSGGGGSSVTELNDLDDVSTVGEADEEGLFFNVGTGAYEPKLIQSVNIENGTITSSDIASSTIVAANLAASSVGTDEIVNGDVQNVDLASNSVSASKIVAGDLNPGLTITVANAFTLDENDIVAPYNYLRLQSTPTATAAYVFEDVGAGDVGKWFEIQNLSNFTINFTGSGVTIQGATELLGSHRLIAYAVYTGQTVIDIKAERPLSDIFIFQPTDETTAIAAATSIYKISFPRGAVLTDVYAYCTTGPTGGNITIDLNEDDGTPATILSTKITINTGENHSKDATAQPVISDPDIGVFNPIIVDIDGITGSPAGLKIYMAYTYTQ